MKIKFNYRFFAWGAMAGFLIFAVALARDVMFSNAGPGLLGFNPLVKYLLEQRALCQQKAALETVNLFMSDTVSMAAFISTQGKPGMRLDVDAQVNYYEKIVENFPDRWDAYSMLGFLYYLKGQANEARQAYQRSVELNPSFFWGHYNLGVLEVKQGQYVQAIRAFEKLSDFNPTETVQMLANSKVFRNLLIQPALKGYNLLFQIKEAYKRMKILEAFCLHQLKSAQPLIAPNDDLEVQRLARLQAF